MSLNKFTLLHEADDHYKIAAPNGKELIMEKANLSKAAQATIAKMKRMSADKACGGMMAKGGEVEEEYKEPTKKEQNLGKAADEQILRSYANRSHSENPREDEDFKVRQKLLNPSQELAEGGDVEEQKLASEDKPLESTYPEAIPLTAAMPLIAPELAGTAATGSAAELGKELMQNPERGSFGGKANNIPGNEMANIAKYLDPIENAALQTAKQAHAAEIAKDIGVHQSLLSKLPVGSPEFIAVEKALAKLQGFAMGGKVKGGENPEGGIMPRPINVPMPDIIRGKRSDDSIPGYAFGGGPQKLAEIQNPISDDTSSGSSGSWDDSTPTPAQASSVPTQAATPVQTTQPILGQFPSYNQALLNEKGANTALATAIGNQGTSESKALDDLDTNVGSMPSQQDIIKQYSAKDQELSDALQNNKIDPNRLFANSSTPNKILAGIGVMLSGIGAGLTGKDNLAVKTINDSIERDIDAQKNDQSNKMNLWKMNRERMGTDLAADLATKNQMYTAAKHQLMKAASLAKGPIAQANAQMANSMVDKELSQNNWLQSMINPTTETSGGAPANTEQAFLNHNKALQAASSYSPILGSQYKENQTRYLPGLGVASIPVLPEDRKQLTNYNDFGKSLDKALAFQQSGPGANVGAWSPSHRAQASQIMGELISSAGPMLLEMKRFNPELADTITASIKNPGSFDLFGSNAAALKQAAQYTDQLKNTKMRDLGIQPFAKAPADQAALKWAQQNPTDPRAAQIMQANGLTR